MLLYHTYSYVSIYLSITFIHTMSPICVCLSLFPHLPLFFTSLCRYSMCTIVFVCLSHSCHILVSTLTVRINLLNCVVTRVSLLARPVIFSVRFSLCNRYRKLILASKKQYYSYLVSSSSDNPRLLWQTINKLLHRNSSSSLSTCQGRTQDFILGGAGWRAREREPTV